MDQYPWIASASAAAGISPSVRSVIANTVSRLANFWAKGLRARVNWIANVAWRKPIPAGTATSSTVRVSTRP